MGDDRLVPKPIDADSPSPFGPGFDVRGILGLQLDTPFAEKGLFGGAGLKVALPDSYRLTQDLHLQFTYGTSSGKLLPTDATTTDSTHWSLMFGGGQTKLLYTLFDRDKDPAFSLFTESRQLLGVGGTSISRQSQYLYFDTFSFGETSATTFDIGSEYTLGGDVHLGKRFQLRLAPGFYYGVQYDGEGSEFNRLVLAFMLNLHLTWGAASIVSGEDAEVRLSAMGNAMEFYKMLHSRLLRYAMNNTLSNPKQELEDYGFAMGNEDSREGPLEMVPVYMAGATLLGGLGSDIAPSLRSDIFWWITGLDAAGGIPFLFLEGDAGKIAGTSDLLRFARRAGYGMAGIESIGKRQALPKEEVESREVWVSLGSYGLGTLLGGIGQLTGSDIVSTGGYSANIPVAFNPGAVSGLVKRLDIDPAFSPLSLRPGLIIHSDWGIPVFSEVSFLYGGGDQNTDINAALGAQWRTPWTRLMGGLNNNLTFGKDPGGRFGLMTGFDVLPLGAGTGFSIGGRFFYTPGHPERPIETTVNLGFSTPL